MTAVSLHLQSTSFTVRIRQEITSISEGDAADPVFTSVDAVQDNLLGLRLIDIALVQKDTKISSPATFYPSSTHQTKIRRQHVDR